MAMVLLYLTSIVTVICTLALAAVHGSFIVALLVTLIGSILIYFEIQIITIFKG